MNKLWTYEEKEKIVLELLSGKSYASVAKSYGIKSTGMMANWKRQYLDGTLSNRKPGKQKLDEAEEYEILKKCYAQLMKIRSR